MSLVNPFIFFNWLTDKPCLLAIAQRLSPEATVYVLLVLVDVLLDVIDSWLGAGLVVDEETVSCEDTLVLVLSFCPG